jgi:hypothetical protein
MKNVDDAIESFFAYLKQYRLKVLSIPLDPSKENAKHLTETSAETIERVQKANVFFMGSLLDLSESIDVVIDDLNEDLRCGFPMPFNEMVMLSKTPESESIIGWVATILMRIPDLMRVPGDRPDFLKNLIFLGGAAHYKGLGWQLQFCILVDILESEDGNFQWQITAKRDLYQKISDEDARFVVLKTFQSMALISHPNNYILLETPKLSPKEERRVKEGKHISGGKRPRYIIVDHEVLVGMRTPSNGHASPVPHKRRGHWMRLAERCIHAKSRGNDRAWVKHCDVGQLEFESERSRYQVLTDFQDRIQREGS